MLRNRSRAVTNKQTLMADHTSSSPSALLTPSQKNPTSPISSFLQSPRFLHTFLAKNPPDSDSPTSILDTKNPSFVNPFGYYDKNLSKPQTPSPDTTAHQFGLALIDSIIVEEDEKGSRNDGSNFPKPVNRMALFGSKLKVQIPAMSNNISSNSNQSSSPGEEVRSSSISPKSPADFGIKTRQNSHVMLSQSTPRDFSRQLSLKEMELSEDYTCVITHGPNPKTTHIFDDCIVECCCGDADPDPDDDVGIGTKFSDLNKPDDDCNNPSEQPIVPSNFLSFCHTCNDILGHGNDIYIYRGDKAFCSHECRFQEMFSERKGEE